MVKKNGRGRSVLLGCAVVAGAILSGGAAPAGDRYTEAEWDAMIAYKGAIRESVRYRVIRMPNNHLNEGKGDTFNFLWRRGSFILENGNGAQVKSYAACIGTLRGRKIRGLTVNDELVVSPEGPGIAY